MFYIVPKEVYNKRSLQRFFANYWIFCYLLLCELYFESFFVL